jgi:hypothetical protein
MSNIVLWRPIHEVHQAINFPGYMTSRYRLGNVWHNSAALLAHGQSVDEVQFISGQSVVVGGIIDVHEQLLGDPDGQVIIVAIFHTIHSQMTDQQIQALGYSTETYNQEFSHVPAHQRNWLAQVRLVE